MSRKHKKRKKIKQNDKKILSNINDSQKEKINIPKVVISVIIFVIFSATGILGWMFLIPKITISQYSRLNPTDAFDTIFEIENNNIFPIYEITGDTYFVDVIMKPVHFSSSTYGNSIQQSSELKPGAKTTFIINYRRSLGGIQPPSEGSIIEIHLFYYYPFAKFWTHTESQRFELVKGTSDGFIWRPLSS